MIEQPVACVVDARGLHCPMPIVRVGRQLKTLAAGQIVKVLVSDRASRTDFPAWVEDTGHELVDSLTEADGTLVFYVRKGATQETE
jgi:TusA-related sulfurtransferase